MPHTLTTPIARPSGTEWRLAAFSVGGLESGAETAQAHFHLVDSGGNIVDRAKWTETDFAALIATLNAQTGTTAARVRKALFARAVAAGVLGAGVTS